MSHSTVLVVISDEDIAKAVTLDGAVSAALDPFDENRRVPRYIKLTKAQAIAKQRDELIDYRDNGYYAQYLADPEGYAKENKHSDHLEYLRTGFPEKLTHLDDEDWLYQQAIERESDLDEDGNITSTYNPQSKWDWWAIGGRWSGAVLNSRLVAHHEAVVRTEKWTDPAWDEYGGGVDFIQKKDLRDCRGTFAFLAADGQWHERGRMGWWGVVSDEAEPDAWDAQFKELLDAVADEDWLVVVDVHI